jgi:hypothetical protein
VQKLLLMSILFSTFILPALAAREPNARRGLKKALLFMVLFHGFYLFALLLIYPRLVAG